MNTSQIMELFKGKYLSNRDEFIKSIKEAKEGKGNFNARLNAIIAALNNENMADIELLLPEDELNVEYKRKVQRDLHH